MNAQQVVDAMNSHIQNTGGGYSSWYVGIASDPNDRLHNGHNADGTNSAARYWDCGYDAVARQVEAAFLRAGCRGGGGGGDRNTRYAYTYRISPTTRE
jgi:hypothetical protein